MLKVNRLLLIFILTGVAACASQPGLKTTVLTAPTGTKPDVAAQLEKGNALYDSRDWAGAEQAFRQTIAADPTLAEAHYNLALTLERTGNKAEAKRHYIDAANLAPGNKVIWNSPPLREQTGGLNYDINKKSYMDPDPRVN
jgi:Tfp pilus assembly protein PilF